MIPFEDMPDDNSELVNIEIAFPLLEPNTADSCPLPLDQVVGYLRVESPDHDSLQGSHLRFLRTALVADQRYWIWRFQESDGSDCYVTVAASPNGNTCIGYEENYYHLTPEQYMLGDYHNVF